MAQSGRDKLAARIARGCSLANMKRCEGPTGVEGTVATGYRGVAPGSMSNYRAKNCVAYHYQLIKEASLIVPNCISLFFGLFPASLLSLSVYGDPKAGRNAKEQKREERMRPEMRMA